MQVQDKLRTEEQPTEPEWTALALWRKYVPAKLRDLLRLNPKVVDIATPGFFSEPGLVNKTPGLVYFTSATDFAHAVNPKYTKKKHVTKDGTAVELDPMNGELTVGDETLTYNASGDEKQQHQAAITALNNALELYEGVPQDANEKKTVQQFKSAIEHLQDNPPGSPGYDNGSKPQSTAAEQKSTEMGPGSQDLMHYNKKLQQYNHWIAKMGPESVNAPKIYQQLQSLANEIGIDPTHLPKSPEELKKDAAESEPAGPPGPTYDQWDKQQQQDKAEDKKKQQSNLVAPEASPAASTGTPTAKGQQIVKGGHNVYYKPEQLRGPGGKWINEGKSDAEKAQMAATEDAAWAWGPEVTLEDKINTVESYMQSQKSNAEQPGKNQAYYQAATQKTAAYLESLYKQEVPTEVTEQVQKQKDQQAKDKKKGESGANKPAPTEHNVAQGATVTTTSGQTGTVTIASTQKPSTYDFAAMDQVMGIGDPGMIDDSVEAQAALVKWYVNHYAGDVVAAQAHAQADLDHVYSKEQEYAQSDGPQDKTQAAAKYYYFLMAVTTKLNEMSDQQAKAVKTVMAGGVSEPLDAEYGDAWNALSTPSSTMANNYPVPDLSAALAVKLAEDWKKSYGTDDVAKGYLKHDIDDSAAKMALTTSTPQQQRTAQKLNALQNAVYALVTAMPAEPSVGQQLQDASDAQKAGWDKGWQYGSYGARFLNVEPTGTVQLYVGGMGGSPQLNVKGKGFDQYIPYVDYDDPQKNYSSMLDALFAQQKAIQQGDDQAAYNDIQAVIDYFQSHDPSEIGMTYPAGAAAAPQKPAQAAPLTPNEDAVYAALKKSTYKVDNWTDDKGNLLDQFKVVWKANTDPASQQQLMQAMQNGVLHIQDMLDAGQIPNISAAKKLMQNYWAVSKYMAEQLEAGGHAPIDALAPLPSLMPSVPSPAPPIPKPAPATYAAITPPKGYKWHKVTLLKATKDNIDEYIADWHGTPAAHYDDITWIQNWAIGQHANHTKYAPDKQYDGSEAYEAALNHQQIVYITKKLSTDQSLTPNQVQSAWQFVELLQHAQDYWLSQELKLPTPTQPTGYLPTYDQFEQMTFADMSKVLSEHGMDAANYPSLSYSKTGDVPKAYSDMVSVLGHPEMAPSLVNKTAGPELTFAKFQMLTFSEKLAWIGQHGLSTNMDDLANDYPNWDSELGSMKAVYNAGVNQSPGYYTGPQSKPGYVPPAPLKDPGPPPKSDNKWQAAFDTALYEYQQYGMYGKPGTTEEKAAAYTKRQQAETDLQLLNLTDVEAANRADALQREIDESGDPNSTWSPAQIEEHKRQLGVLKEQHGVTPQKEPQLADYPSYKAFTTAHSKWEKLHTKAAGKAQLHPAPMPKNKAGAQQIIPGLEDPYLNSKGEVQDAARFDPMGLQFKNYGGPNEVAFYDTWPDIKISYEQSSALSGYMDGDYGDMNPQLRKAKNPDSVASHSSSIKALDAVYDMPEAKAPTHLLTYRSGDMVDTDGNGIWEPGEILWDNGFQSMSNNLRTAQSFGGRVLFAIEIPQGANVIWAQKAMGYGPGGESEILGRRGAKFVRVGDLHIDRTDTNTGYTYDAKYDYEHLQPIKADVLPISKDKYGTATEGLTIPRLRYLGPDYDPSNPAALALAHGRPSFGTPGYGGPAPGEGEPRPEIMGPTQQQKLPTFSRTTITITGGTGGTGGPDDDQDQDQEPDDEDEDEDEGEPQPGRDTAFQWGAGDLRRSGQFIDEYRRKPPEGPDSPTGMPQEPPGSPQSDFPGGTGTNILPEPKRQPQGFSERHPFLSSLATFAFNPQESRDWHGKWVEGGIHNAQPPDKSGRYQTSTATMEPSAQSSQSVAPNADTIFGQRTGGALGSNSGGFWTGKDKVERYVKNYEDPVQGYGEVVANKLYRELGLNAPNAQNVDTDQGTVYASDIVKGSSPDMQIGKLGLTMERALGILKGYAADVLTANWDVLGLNMDNVLDVKGEIYRIDNGSAFLHRAQGARKAENMLKGLSEWESLGPNGRNDNYAKVWEVSGRAGPEAIGFMMQKSIARIVKLRDTYGGWDKFVTQAEPRLQGKDKDAIVGMLEDRTNRLVDKMKELAAADERGTDKYPAPDAATQKRVEYWVKANIAKYGEKYKDRWEAGDGHWHAYMAHDAINELHLDSGKDPAPFMWIWGQIQHTAHEYGYMEGGITPHMLETIPEGAKPKQNESEAKFTVANFLYNPGQMRGPDGRWVDEGRGYQPHPRVSDPRQAGQQQPPQGGTGQYDVLKQRMLQPGPQKMQAVPRQEGANWRDQAAKLGAGGRLSMYDMQQVHEQAKAQGYNELAQHMEEKQQDPDAKANWFHELTELAPTVEGLRGNRPPPDQKRKMVNLGLTPSRSKPVAAVEDTEPYYQSTRYKGWLRDVRTEAHRTHVTIHDVTKAAGVWKGKLEPSASIWLSGEPADLKDFAGSLGGEYNQESVMMFSGDDDDGKSALYSIPELQAKERDQAISLMSQYGLDGGRIVQERNGNFTLEVADEDGSLYNGVLKLGSSLGKDIYGAPGKVSFLSGGTDYPRRSHPHKGAAQTHAYVEARTKAAEEGDDFAA